MSANVSPSSVPNSSGPNSAGSNSAGPNSTGSDSAGTNGAAGRPRGTAPGSRRGLRRAAANLWRYLGALSSLLRGRWRLFRRDVDGAVASLDSAARRAPDSFSPWFHLARAHLRNRDLPGARRALARARAAAPERFDHVAVRALRDDGFELSILSEPVTVAPAAQVAPGARVERAAVRMRSRESATLHPLGDCRDLDEYARFRSMPPITAAEIENVDWDAIADDLLDG